MALLLVGWGISEGVSTSLAEMYLASIVDAIGTAIVTAIGIGAQEATKPHPSSNDKAPFPSSAIIFPEGGTHIADHLAFESPLCTPDTIMTPLNKRVTTPIESPAQGVERDQKLRRKGPGSRTQVVYEGPEYVSDLCRDFSGIQRTVVNPISGRIIGYKGIRPRKRKFDLVKKYSSFWRDYDRAKSSFRAARSPGIWDSARR